MSPPLTRYPVSSRVGMHLRTGSNPGPSSVTAALSIAPTTGAEPLPATLDASASRTRVSDIASYRFVFGDATPDKTTGPAQPSWPHTWAAGSYAPKVFVTDTDGNVDSAAVTLVVAKVGTPATGYLLEPYMGSGGGGQASESVSPFDPDEVLSGTDTHGMSHTRDGGKTTARRFVGFRSATGRPVHGSRASRKVPGRRFFVAGKGGDGGVYVIEGLNTDSPSAAQSLDGQGTMPNLNSLNGGNIIGNVGPPDMRYKPKVTGGGGYPRHYGSAGSIIEIDETSVPGFTLVHVCTPTQGVVTLKCSRDAAGKWTTASQTVWAGTTGGFPRCFRFAVSETNEANNDFTRAIVAMYDGSGAGTAMSMRVCDNPHTANPTTTAIGGPDNVECISRVKGTKAGAVEVWCAVKAGQVWFSTNAGTAAAAAIAWTNVAGDAGAPPSAASANYYAGVELAESTLGGDYRVLVGLVYPPGAPGAAPGSASIWRGTFAATHATPWGAGSIAWKAQDGSNSTLQIFKLPGVGNELNYNNGPNMNTGSMQSGFATAPSMPSRVFAVSRGNTYRSDDGGQNWYPIRVWSTFCPWGHAFDPTRAGWGACCTVDWPALGSTDGLVSQPFGLVGSSPQGAAVCFDGVTHDSYYGCSDNSNQSPTRVSVDNEIFVVSAAEFAAGKVLSHTAFTAKRLAYNTGGTGGEGLPAKMLVYRAAKGTGVAGLVVGALGGKGLHYCVNPKPGQAATAWKHFTGAGDPYVGGSAAPQSSSIAWERSSDTLAGYDRGNDLVWRAHINADGSLDAPVVIGSFPASAGYPADSTGYVAWDPRHPGRLVVAHSKDIYYLDNAPSAAAATGLGAFKAVGVFPPGGRYAGEMPGPMLFTDDDVCHVQTVAFANNNTPNAGTLTRGVRFLDISGDVALATSWANAFDRCTDDSRGRSLFHPQDIAASADGKLISVTCQTCGGGGTWRAP